MEVAQDARLLRLRARHFRILEMCLLGMKQVEISKELGIGQNALSRVVNSPVFQDELARRREVRERQQAEENSVHLTKAKQVLVEAAEEAAEVQKSLLHSEDDRVRLNTSDSILDRVLGKEFPIACRDRKNGGVSISFSGDTIQILALAIKEASGKELAVEPESKPDPDEGTEAAGS